MYGGGENMDAGHSSAPIIHETLLGWEEQTRMMIINRFHNYGGIFYDRGLFRFNTPSFTKEHDLDLITYGYTPAEHHSWYYNREGNSFRTFMGSFNLGKFLHGAEIRNTISLPGRLSVPLHYIRRYDMRADRQLLMLALNYEISPLQQVGLRHTLNEQKPDLDATLYYRYGTLWTGYIEVDVTALDWANNSAYDLGQKRGTDIAELRKYELQPWLFTFRANSPTLHGFRLEATGGIMTPSVAVAESMPGTSESFREREVARYGGVMIEYARPYVTAGLSFRHTWTRFSRANALEVFEKPVDYGNRQIRNSLGAFLGLSWNRFYLHNRIWRDYNLDAQYDHHEQRMEHGVVTYPFDFREFRLQTQIRLGYNPDRRGFTTAIEWSSDSRMPTENFIIDDELHSRGLPFRIFYPTTFGRLNKRITMQFGYRFNEKTWFTVGASFDADGDRQGGYWDRIEREAYSGFDGGFARLVVFY